MILSRATSASTLFSMSRSLTTPFSNSSPPMTTTFFAPALPAYLNCALHAAAGVVDVGAQAAFAQRTDELHALQPRRLPHGGHEHVVERRFVLAGALHLLNQQHAFHAHAEAHARRGRPPSCSISPS